MFIDIATSGPVACDDNDQCAGNHEASSASAMSSGGKECYRNRGIAHQGADQDNAREMNRYWVRNSSQQAETNRSSY